MEIPACGPVLTVLITCSWRLPRSETQVLPLGRNSPRLGERPFIVGFLHIPSSGVDVLRQTASQPVHWVSFEQELDREVHSVRPARPSCLREVAASESLKGS